MIHFHTRQRVYAYVSQRQMMTSERDYDAGEELAAKFSRYVNKIVSTYCERIGLNYSLLGITKMYIERLQ